MTPDELMGVTEIAGEFDIVPSAISNWQKRDVGFPQPWGTWRMGSLWLRSEVEDWVNARIANSEAKRQSRIIALEAQLERLRR